MLKELYQKESVRLSGLRLNAEADLLNPVFGEGQYKKPRIMFIGEAPGKEEAAIGRPFVGKAGKQLDGMLQTAGIDRNDVFVTNAVKYRPYRTKNGRAANRTPSVIEIELGAELLLQEIVEVDPAVIATLGNVPLSSVCSLSEGDDRSTTVGQAHGVPIELMIGGKPRRVFPLYHPAASIYNRALAPVLQQDLINLGKYAMSLE